MVLKNLDIKGLALETCSYSMPSPEANCVYSDFHVLSSQNNTMILIYFIWKYINDLSKQFNREKSWPAVLVGVIIYLAGNFLGGIIIGVGCLMMDINIDEVNDTLINLMAWPVGILVTVLYYQYLKKKWASEYVDPELALDDIGAESEVD